MIYISLLPFLVKSLITDRDSVGNTKHPEYIVYTKVVYITRSWRKSRKYLTLTSTSWFKHNFQQICDLIEKFNRELVSVIVGNSWTSRNIWNLTQRYRKLISIKGQPYLNSQIINCSRDGFFWFSFLRELFYFNLQLDMCIKHHVSFALYVLLNFDKGCITWSIVYMYRVFHNHRV